MKRLVGSPTFDPQMPLEEVLRVCADMGFTKFEVFTTWTASAFDINHDPDFYRALGARYGLRFSSVHLPPVQDDLQASLAQAIQGATFAYALGADVVIFKASSRANYIRAAAPFLDAISALPITAVITNHANSPISSVADYREVLDGIDRRMMALLEVGHFHAVGHSWQEAYQLLGDRVALVHIKDMAGNRPVPYGEGEVDFAGLFAALDQDGYKGDIVVELEKVPQTEAVARLRDAVNFLRPFLTLEKS